MTDLDCADLVEVSRRVVSPVCQLLPRSWTVRAVHLQFGLPEGHAPALDDDAPEVWLLLSINDREFQTRVCKATFERWDAQDLANLLLGEIEEWGEDERISGSKRLNFEMPEVPGPIQAAAGEGSSLEVYPVEGVDYPLWQDGSNITPSQLTLSPAVDRLLRAWQLTWSDETGREEGTWSDWSGALENSRMEIVWRLREELDGRRTVITPKPLPR